MGEEIFDLFDPPRIVPTKVEPKRDTFDASDTSMGSEREIMAFMLPLKLDKARSAYCYDPTFQMAIDVYCDRNNQRPEEALSDNLGHRLTVEKRLLQPTISAPTFDSTPPEPDSGKRAEDVSDRRDDTSEVTISELKAMYAKGEIDILTFENRVEEVLERNDA